jgi:hypothetical protein
MYCLVYYLFILLVFDRYCLDVSLLKKTQDYEENTLSNIKQEARQVFPDHIDPICFLPLVHTIACIPEVEYLPHTFRIGFVWMGRFA